MSIQVGFYSEDKELRQHLSKGLGEQYEVSLVPDPSMLSVPDAKDFNVIIMDLLSNYHLHPERIDMIRSVITRHKAVIVMADQRYQMTAEELVRAGAIDRCGRPPEIDKLISILRQAEVSAPLIASPPTLQLRKPSADFSSSNHCDGLVGSSPIFNKLYETIHRVAGLNASVLISGESGTGKELVARAIHNLGTRTNQPFVAVSCSAIPETLIESELFGHEKGAFTGTFGARQGYMEQAGAGTLFLDEIGDISIYTQIKLLRVLQQMEFARLGSNKLIKLRARLVFATHRNLEEMVAAGKFRHDLFYRINVVKLKIPALRDHAEDIPELATYFLKTYASQYSVPEKRLDSRALTVLQSYNWPGNVRELENVIQNALILSDSSCISAEDILRLLKCAIPQSQEQIAPIGSFEQRIRDFKYKLALEAVEEAGGNKTIAAQSLQISRAYLHRLLHLGNHSDSDMLEEAL